MNPYMRMAKKAVKDFFNKPWQQGWQWRVEIEAPEAPEDFDLYVKDIDYGEGSIDVDTFSIGSGSIAYPTFSSVSEITMTVRDDEQGTMRKFFEARLAKVKNKDGTLNLPIDYIFKIHIFDLDSDGNKRLRATYQVFPTKKGNVTQSRENGNVILSYPIIFQKFMSVGNKVF
ncbi:hypothetical protein [Vibrio campbellii]|uniref:hypothetical protein n=1 Tax=Vibrio campbellii TaxID=680 RepID=UPI002109AF67|nr:hypothetical protein [Vibrio campbellii]UTZ44600.1 hypothetical protein HB764_25410 [Vibrio campbellii]